MKSEKRQKCSERIVVRNALAKRIPIQSQQKKKAVHKISNFQKISNLYVRDFLLYPHKNILIQQNNSRKYKKINTKSNPTSFFYNTVHPLDA